MQRVRKKDVLGIKCVCSDGVTWTWYLDQTCYRWCPDGQVLVCIEGGQSRLVMMSQKIEGGVGYTMGYVDALAYVQRQQQEASKR